jgi:hypothetical protein
MDALLKNFETGLKISKNLKEARINKIGGRHMNRGYNRRGNQRYRGRDNQNY